MLTPMNQIERNGREISHARHVRDAVESASSAAQSALAASWRRSLLFHKLDPETKVRPDRVEICVLRQASDRLGRLAKIATLGLDRIFAAVGHAGCCVLFADSEGLILEHRAMPSDSDLFGHWGLWSGSIWSEGNEGTNGIGTCLAEQRPVAVLGNEHFHARNSVMRCMGAPIFDENAALAAVIDVSTCSNTQSIGNMTALISMIVSDAARKIESENFREAFRDCRIVMPHEQDSRCSALLAVNQYDIVVGATRSARQSLGASGNILGRPLADILAKQRQSSDLHEAERAELHRAIARCDGNLSAAARDLGIGRATLYRKMNRFGIAGVPDSFYSVAERSKSN
jgi:transcriptional regulator of acetoin/glycerol metabolism